MGSWEIAAVVVAAAACAVVALLLAMVLARRRARPGDEALFQQSVNGMLLVGLDGTVLRANPAACALLGATESELAGRDWAELLHPGDRLRAGRLVETLAGGTPGWRQGARLVHAGGQPVQADLAAWLARDQRGRARHAVVQATEAREPSQQALVASERRFRGVFDQALVGMVLAAPSGHLVAVNQAFCDLVGRDRDDLLGRHWSELTHPGDQERLRADLARTLSGEHDGYHSERRYVRPDGGVVHAEVATALLRDGEGRPQHFATQVLDIGARTRLEAQVEAERDLSDRLLANLSQLGAGVTVVEGGRLVFVNDAFSALTGYSSEELLAMPDTSALVVENYRADLAAAHQRVADDEETAGVYETALRHRDGHIVAVEVASRVMRQHARPQRVSLVRDISDRVRWERSLTEHARAVATINEELREANQVKSDLVAMLSHDLGQPLTVVSGYLDVLAEDWATLDDGQRQDMIARVSGAAKRIRTLVGNILTMSRLEAGAIQANQVPVPADDAVAEVMAGLAGTVPGLATGELTGAAVMADPSQLHQVLVNLVTNAAKYGAPPVRLSAAAGDGWVELRVRDHGAGVPEEFVPRLFDRFSRAGAGSEGPAGTGLGLFIVKRLVEANGGRIWYEPAEPGLEPPGACFVVRLPQPEPVAVRSG